MRARQRSMDRSILTSRWVKEQVSVFGLERRGINPDAVEPDHAVDPFALDRHLV